MCTFYKLYDSVCIPLSFSLFCVQKLPCAFVLEILETKETVRLVQFRSLVRDVSSRIHSKLRERQGSNHRNIEYISKKIKPSMTLQTEEEVFVSRRSCSLPPCSCSRCRSTLLVPTSSQIPFGRRNGRSSPVYTSARRKALEENSTRGVSASVPYFARRRPDSAKGLRGFTSITEIHRDTYNGALFDAREIDEALKVRQVFKAERRSDEASATFVSRFGLETIFTNARLIVTTLRAINTL